MALTALDEVDEQLSKVIQSLYFIISVFYDHQGSEASTPAATREITGLLRNLYSLIRICQAESHAIPFIPPEIIQYVEEGRNPDIYTREFVEVVQKNNQILKGRSQAFARFRDILAKELVQEEAWGAEWKDEVDRVVNSTSGTLKQ